MPRTLNVVSILGIIVGLMVAGYWLGTSLLFLQKGRWPESLVPAATVFFIASGLVLAVASFMLRRRIPFSRPAAALGWAMVAMTLEPNYLAGIVALVAAFMFLRRQTIEEYLRGRQAERLK
jgi:Na+/glutamate symporter